MNILKLLTPFFFTISAFCQINIESAIIENKVKEVRIFDSENNLVSVCKYNTNAKILFRSSENFASAMFLKTSETNIYNENNKVIETISTHSSFDKPTVWIKEYDGNQNLINIKDENGNMVFQYFYDQGKVKNKELMYEDNKVSQITTYEIFDDGKKSIELINGKFLKDRKNISFFDNNGNKIRTESYNSGKLQFSSNSIYKKNRKVKIIYDGNYGENYYYDSKNRLIKRELFKKVKQKEIVDNYEMFEYYTNDLISKYIENIYSIAGISEYRYEYDFF